MLDPIIISFFGINIYWYGLFYALGFLFSYFFILHYANQFNIKKDIIEDIIFYAMLFGVLGGRLGYILFYNPTFYLQNPLEIFKVWNGGMSIHGGFIGGFLALYHQSKKHKLSLLKLTDLFVIPLSLALAFGRLANFINQELVGTITNSKLAIIFPLHDNNTRWPYTIFASIKNMLLFQILFYLQTFKKLKTGIITALFIIIYNLGRFFLDFTREPTLSLGIISQGQLISLIFTAIGFYILIKISLKKEKD